MDLDRSAIRTLSTRYGLPADMIEALTIVESAGVPGWAATYQGKAGTFPVIRFEGHYFYRRLSGASRKAAVQQHLASPKAGAIPNPKSGAGRYALLERAQKINPEAALESISIGVGQVMGAHWKLLGFNSASEMFDFACGSLSNQIELMCKFIASQPSLKQAVQEKNYKTVALLYNGKGYEKNHYDNQIELAAKKAVDGSAPVVSAKNVSGDWKDAIDKLGYEDVQSFQTERGLLVDGIVGPATIAEIKVVQAERAAAAKAADKPKKQTIGAAVGTGSIAVVTAGASYAKDAVDGLNPVVDYIRGIGEHGAVIASALGVGALVVAFAYYMATQRGKPADA